MKKCSENYKIQYSKKADQYISTLSSKQLRQVSDKIEECLMQNPKGRTPHCNIKLIEGTNPEKYRLHIAMTHTLIYGIDENNRTVNVFLAMSIEQAHKKYRIV